MIPVVLPSTPYTENYSIPEAQFGETTSIGENAEKLFKKYSQQNVFGLNGFDKERLLDQTKQVHVIQVSDTSVSKYDFELMGKSEILKQLNIINNLPDNWDSYGSPKLERGLFVNARQFVRFLDSLFIDSAPDVVPISGGGVQFEWQYGGRELEIEFSTNSIIEYLKVDEDENMEENLFSIEQMTDEIPKLFSWLFNNNQ